MAKLILYDFRCNEHECSTKFEDLVPSSELVGTCPACGGEAKRLISAPRMDPKMGVDPDSSMGDKWARKMENRYKEVERRRKDHGDEL